jgi:hypothetical protein
MAERLTPVQKRRFYRGSKSLPRRVGRPVAAAHFKTEDTWRSAPRITAGSRLLERT